MQVVYARLCITVALPELAQPCHVVRPDSSSPRGPFERLVARAEPSSVHLGNGEEQARQVIVSSRRDPVERASVCGPFFLPGSAGRRGTHARRALFEATTLALSRSIVITAGT